VDLLERENWSVFWDRTIPVGETWRSHIGRAVEQARCVVVVWSEHSITSDWVIQEADDARLRDILVPVMLGTVRPPMGFREIQAADFAAGVPSSRGPAANLFLAAVARVVGTGLNKAALPPSEPANSSRSPRIPLVAAAGVLALVAMAGGGLAYYATHRDQLPPPRVSASPSQPTAQQLLVTSEPTPLVNSHSPDAVASS